MGPEAITERSSPGTSEMTRLTNRAGAAAAASRPPLIAERCLRTAFISPMRAPLLRSARFTACLSASVTPPAGSVSKAEPPPEMRPMTRSSLVKSVHHGEDVAAPPLRPPRPEPDGPPRRRGYAWSGRRGRRGSRRGLPAAMANGLRPPPPLPPPPCPRRRRWCAPWAERADSKERRAPDRPQLRRRRTRSGATSKRRLRAFGDALSICRGDASRPSARAPDRDQQPPFRS